MSTITATNPTPVREPAPPLDSTLDELLAMPVGVRHEVVDGRLMEWDRGFQSRFVGTRLARLLGDHCDLSGLACVVSEHGYACFPSKPNRMRRADVSLILAARMTPDLFAEGFTSIRPDLAVEVVSPNDLALDLEEKLDDDRDARISLIWVVFPPLRRVRVLRSNGSATNLGPDDERSGEDAIPGFRRGVADLSAGLPDLALEPRKA